MKEEDHFIEGLEFAGAHSISGNGMGPAVTNGRAAAKGIFEALEKSGQMEAYQGHAAAVPAGKEDAAS